ncbi:MAG: TonB family protein [Fibrobacteres bacterium]|nr:TonB family protein [Fibrobacterota bacterium]
MSGENVLPFFGKKKIDPYQERFEIENDRRLFGCMGSGSMFGIALVVYALSITIIIPPFGDGFDRGDPVAPVWPGNKHHDERILIKPLANYHGSIRERRQARVNLKPGKPGHETAKAKTRKPALKNPGVLAVNVIGALKGLGSGSAYSLLPKSVRNTDLNKLEEFGSLTRTDKTRIGGRLGRQSNEYNESYYQGGTGDKDGTGIELPGLPDAPIPGSLKKSNIADKMVEIDAIQNTTSRSTASILAVIRSHSPGLRHLYNMHLKMRPGMAGKITLRFAIAPSGQVVDVGLAGSTTSAPDFDAQVLEKVMSWRFEAVKAIGNDMVTVPFNFSE